MSTPLLHLQDALTSLSIAPSLGASLVNWQVKASGQPLLRPTDANGLASANPRALGCYPLVPWSNRIAGGGIATPDGWLQLSPNTTHDPYPIHGSGWQQAWEVQRQTQRSARLGLSSQIPFAYQALLDINLHDGCLTLQLTVIHQDTRPMWHGLGLHPYFPRNAHTRLQAAAETVWIGEPGQLPERQEAVPQQWRFERLRPLPTAVVDHAFSGWSGQCLIEQADAGYRLSCSAQGAEHFLLFCPEQRDFFCFEPVSHPINAHHLPQRPGLRLLQRGQRHTLGLRLQYQPLAEQPG